MGYVIIEIDTDDRNNGENQDCGQRKEHPMLDRFSSTYNFVHQFFRIVQNRNFSKSIIKFIDKINSDAIVKDVQSEKIIGNS